MKCHLHPTEWDETNPDAIWPEANEINIDLEKLVSFKLQRNTSMRQANSRQI